MWVLAALVGCEPRIEQVDDACPTLTEGVEVAVGQSRDGMNLTFTTEAGDVAELRGRVLNLARQYEGLGGRGALEWPELERTVGAEPGLPALVAVVSPMTNGARLRVDAVHTHDTEILQQQVRLDVDRLLRGECPVPVPVPEGGEPAEGMRQPISGET